ncbi:sel1 repeat family protein [Emcibacteraceae bacterium]|nr:sel1 repeat family protein [Emcibacteraceae bacterium]
MDKQSNRRLGGLWIKARDAKSAAEAASHGKYIAFLMAFGYVANMVISFYIGRDFWTGEYNSENEMYVLNGLGIFGLTLFSWLGMRIEKGKYGSVPFVTLWFFLEVAYRTIWLTTIGVRPTAGWGLTIPLSIIAINAFWGWFKLKSFKTTIYNVDPKEQEIAEYKNIAEVIEDTPDARANEDQLFTQVAEEMANDDIKAGLWAKATVHAEGDEGKTKAFYIKYRVQAIRNEVEERAIRQREKQEQARLDNLKKIKEEKEAKEAANTLRKAQEHFNEGLEQKKKDNFHIAEKEFEKAALLGHSLAQCELGMIFLCNRVGVSASYKDARKWFSLSAEQGNSSAKYNLGLIYKNGLGVNVDLVQAFIWFKEAAILDHQLAKEEVSKLLAEDKNNYLTKELMEQLVDNEVRFDGVKFHYTGYAYDNLEAALTYAKSCNS